MTASHLRVLFAMVLLLGAASHSMASHKLRLGTYNIRLDYDGDHASGNGWDKRRDQVLSLVRFHDFELIGFQEVIRKQLDDLLALQSYAYVGVGRDDGANAGEFAPIFYRKDRFQLLDCGTFWLSETPEKVSYGWDATKYHRICTWAKLKDSSSGRVIQIWNAHFDHEAPEAKRNSAKLILSLISKTAQPDSLVIFLGDLNSIPDSEPYRIISSRLRDTRNISEQPPYGPEGTFNNFQYDLPCTDRIDHIFVGDGVRVLRHGTLSDSHNQYFPSDHFPLLTELSY